MMLVILLVLIVAIAGIVYGDDWWKLLLTALAGAVIALALFSFACYLDALLGTAWILIK